MTNNNSNDVELMTRLAKGDMSALGDIVRKHQDKVLSLSYRVLGDWHRAEDVTQETFLRIHRAAKNYKSKAKFTTWLYRIVINLCFDEQRKRAKAAAPLEDADSVVLAESNCNASERKEVVKSVKTAVNELPERQRLAVILHRYDGLSHAEIGEVTGWTKSAVESLLVRAYANLREKLNKMKYFDK
ncbi:MAG: sigma-70 family RNA polymerase sigma factor [Planctomycetes bacterium]|nr:sigma-70 family RNA polymerase sigma factor [Planctomycetota bacterium]